MSTASKVASKKSTKKTAKKTAAKKGTDLILNIIHRVENITKEKFGTKIAELREGRDEEFFEMGGYLTVAMEKGWHRDAGYTDFRDWIGDKHGLNARSGRHMMTVYQKVTDAELEWKDVDGVGWTKLRTLASIMTKENAKKLLKGAKDLTTRELEKFVKDQNPRARTSSGTSGGGVEQSDGMVKLAVKFHPDQWEPVQQATDNIKEQADTDNMARAIELMAIEYNGGGKEFAGSHESAKESVKRHGWEAILEAVGEHYDDQIDIHVKVKKK